MSNIKKTQVGNQNVIGFTPVSIYSTNLSTYNLLNLDSVPANALIISSPIDNEGFDKGIPAILMSDGNGKVLPLTYSISVVGKLGKSYDNHSNTCIISYYK